MLRPRYAIPFVIGVALGALTLYAASPAQIDAQRPMESLYRLRWQAAQSGWTPDMHRQAGDLYEFMGDLPAAVAHWQAANPTAPDDLRQLADGYLRLSAWSESAATLRALIAADSSNSYAHYQLGMLLAPTDPLAATDELILASENPVYRQSAQDFLTEFIDLDNPTPLAIRVGMRLLKEGRLAYAERAFTFASAWNYPAPIALAYASLARTQQGKDGRAAIENAVTAAPDSPSVQFAYGLYLREVGDTLASRDALAIAASLDPNQPAYYAELGTAAELLQQVEEAAYWLLLAVQTSDYAPEYVARLTRFYAQTDYPVDPAFLENLLAGMPANAEALAIYGWSLFESGDVYGGLEQIDTALERSPQSVDARYYKARLLLEIGQVADSLPILQALGRDESPRQAWALQMLDILQQTMPELTLEAPAG